MSALRVAALLILWWFPANHALADYITPGTGVDWTMDDLVIHSGGVVTGGAGAYEVLQSVVVAPGDRLNVAAGAALTFLDTGGTVGLEIRGALRAIGTTEAPIVFDSATQAPGAWRGLDYTDTVTGSEFHLAYCEIAHSMIAVDVYGADVLLQSCDIHDCLDKALDFSAAGGEVTNCRLHENRQRTVVMTLTSSPLIQNCALENNNIENSSPYPYINIGLQGVNSPTIRGCTILGSNHQMSGGIAIWNASNGRIEDNHIEGCGYGILCYQTGANPAIHGNTLLANDIHPDTLNWGFGLACNGNNAPVVTENIIRGHWYGVAAINGGRPNLGDLNNASPADDGRNYITENGLGSRIYGFYNNTPLPQTAQGNWWGGDTAQEVENAIYHQPDDPSLGLVDYSQWIVSAAAGDPVRGLGARPEAVLSSVLAYPNPFVPYVQIALTLARESRVTAVVSDVGGRTLKELYSGSLLGGGHVFAWDGTDRGGRPLPAGTYFYRVTAETESAAGRLILLR